MDQQKKTEAWLRGPQEGIHPVLQPVAHTFTQVREDFESICGRLNNDLIWQDPGGIATIGFHLNHLAGSTDRLLTYARGEELSEEQTAALNEEKKIHERKPTCEELTARLRNCFGHALSQLRSTDPATFDKAREVGRKKMPSTVIGLLFHAAEHAQRHLGQITTTLRILQSQ